MSSTAYEIHRAARERVITAAGKRIPQASAASQARALGLWRGKEVKFTNEAQFFLVLDLAILGPVGGHTRALDREAKAGDYPEGSDDARVLAALSHAPFTLFRVGAPHPEGGIMAEDLLRGTSLHIQDQVLAREEVQGCGFAGRLMRLDGFEMTCGAVAPVTDEVIEALLGRPAPIKETPRFLPPLTPLMEPDVVALRAAAMAEDFAARVYRTSLDHGLFGRLPD
ncbi:MAG: hypothetical protein K5Q68_21920 [Roseococcus sp.]|nr:hypothetical protein [Roseococcus sp.]